MFVSEREDLLVAGRAGRAGWWGWLIGLVGLVGLVGLLTASRTLLKDV